MVGIRSSTLVFLKKKEPNLSTELGGWIWLRFLEPRMELAYLEEMLDSGVHSRSKRVMVLGGMSAGWCAMYGFGNEDYLWAARGAFFFFAVFYVVYALAMKKNPWIVGFNHASLMLVSYMLVALCVSLTRDRWARMFQNEDMHTFCHLNATAHSADRPPDEKCNATGLMEASAILCLSGLVNLSAFFSQLPTGHCFLLVNFSVVMYVSLALGLGSLERQMMDDVLEDSWENHRLLQYCLLGAGLYLLGILTITSRRGLELKDRRAFASCYLKLAKREWEEREDRKAVARQNELAQRLNALMTPHGSLDDDNAGSHNNTEDSGNQGHVSDGSHSSGAERMRSLRIRATKSDKGTDSNPHSSSDGTQESNKSKMEETAKAKRKTPSLSLRSRLSGATKDLMSPRSNKTADSGFEESPWLKTVEHPPVWFPTKPPPDEVKVEAVDVASSNSTTVPGVVPCSVPSSATPAQAASGVAVGGAASGTWVMGSGPTSPTNHTPMKSGASGHRKSLLSVTGLANEVPQRRKSMQRLSFDQVRPPNTRLVTQMAGHTADLPRIRRMAENIRKPEYNLRMFFDDCVNSFPELTLFTNSDVGETGRMTASGRSAEVEYQRTVGALFAVYWLLRLDSSGKESFCFGVNNDNWEVRAPAQAKTPASADNKGRHSTDIVGHRCSGSADLLPKNPLRRRRRGSVASAESLKPDPAPADKKLLSQMTPEERRAHFLHTVEWSHFEELVSQAGCGWRDPNRIENIMAMLCLTSFHDIMKMEDLLPVVQAEHAPYCGYQAGVTIQDHDAALAYILENYPEVLPSFRALGPYGQELIVFSQSKLHFNHGWFVQAEAPPGIMLSKFKQVLSSGASPRHVGFYFFHWITDLSGAEGTPLGGAEKFVLKFPCDVLASFLWSMPFLGKLVDKNETEVVEDYLRERWRMLTPGAGLPVDPAAENIFPTGPSAIARMRLAVMVQEVGSTLQAFDVLQPMEMTTLSEELARTGVADQHYTESIVSGGPAFLVYYGPALIQQNCSSLEDLTAAMAVLARVLMSARKLWPAHPDEGGRTVTIQVGELKSKNLECIVGAPLSDVRQVWILVKQNDNEGAVMLRQAAELNWMFATGQQFIILDFSTRNTFRPDADFSNRLSSGDESTPKKKGNHSPKAKLAPPPKLPLVESQLAPAVQREPSSPNRRRNSQGTNGQYSTGSCNTYEFMPGAPNSHHSSMNVREVTQGVLPDSARTEGPPASSSAATTTAVAVAPEEVS